jgi:lipopolysaccharide/colanic/teichoic acid biosynthesis glycosyltransferase
MSVSPPLSFLRTEPHPELLDPETLARRRLFHLCKRGFDFVFASLMLLILLPVGVLIAVLIKLDSRGPVLFVNRAVGQHGREFRLFKFRSMYPLAWSETARADVTRNIRDGTPTAYIGGQPVYKTAFAERSRITRIGGLLRRASLDELPQLWNILKGDLSFVGPRPSLPEEVGQYKDWQKQRLLVPQGLTGLYQVSARNRVSIEEMIRIDLEYIRNCSWWMDLKILVKTPRAMLSGL